MSEWPAPKIHQWYSPSLHCVSTLEQSFCQILHLHTKIQSWWLCPPPDTCFCLLTHTHAHICTHTHRRACTPTRMHTNSKHAHTLKPINRHAHVYVHTHSPTGMHTYGKHAYAHTRIYMHGRKQTWTNTCTYMRMHSHLHMHTYTHICAHVYAVSFKLRESSQGRAPSVAQAGGSVLL